MKNRNAFTMIELIMVMVVMGILASLSIPRVKRDERSEAIIHMLSMIRYTQDLALHDSKHKRFNGRWQRAYWRFQIYQCANSGLFYMIGTDKDLNGNLNLNETAIDPSNGKYTFWNRFVSCPKNSTDALNQKVSPNIFITQRYGISSVNFNSCRVYKDNRTQHSNVKHIGFDSFGRPYKSFLGRLQNNI